MKMFMEEKCMKILRPILYEDVKFLNKWKNDPEIFQYLGGGYHPVSIDEQKKWMDDLIVQSSSNKRFMIHPKESKKPIGMIGLYNINWFHRTAEIGIYIGEKEWHRKGMAQKAYDELEYYATDFLNLRKLKAFTVKDNKQAVNFFEKQKYNVVGEFHEERYIKGKYCNLFVLEKFINV